MILYDDYNGTIDNVIVWNRTLSDSEIEFVYYSNITKTTWNSYEVNINKSMNNLQWNYFNISVGDNSNNINIYNTYFVNKIINFSHTNRIIGKLNDYFYGVNFHSGWFTGYRSIINNSGSTINENKTWHQIMFNISKMNYLRNDMSVDGYYNGMYNNNFEDVWLNTSFNYSGSGVTNVEMPRGYTINIGGFGNGSAYQTSDAYSGTKALTLNTSQGYIYIRTSQFTLPNNTFYNFSIVAKGQGSLQITLQDYDNSYQNNCSGTTSRGLSATYTNLSIICQTNVSLNNHRYYFTIDGIRANVTIDDWNITYLNATSFPIFLRTGNITKLYDDYQMNHNNNIRSLMIFSYMPTFIANISYGCNQTAPYKCPSLNYDTYAKIGVDQLDRTTGCEGNQTCRNQTCDIDFEVWNEPYGSFLYDKETTTDSINKTIEYIKLYNSSYNVIKQYYPCVAIGGPSASVNYSYSPQLIDNFLKNFTNRMDFFSWHPYDDEYSTGFMNNSIESIMTRCNLYSANCSRLIAGEWNSNGYRIKNGTNGILSSNSIFNSLYDWKWLEMDNAYAYIKLINSYPSNLSNTIYQWTSGYNVSYGQYTDNGYHYDAVDETDNIVYPIYTVTSNLTRYSPSQSNIYISNSSSEEVIVSFNKIGSTCSINLVNKYNDLQNISLIWDSGLCGNLMIDTTTGRLITNGGYITMDRYDVKYLTSPTALQIGNVWYWTNSFLEPIRQITQSEINNYVIASNSLRNPGNPFYSSYQFIIGGGGALISSLLIIGILYMFMSNQIPFQTFIKTIIIAVIMLLIAGMILLL